MSESNGNPRWHPAYADGVMAADQRFAARALYDTFLDVCSVHLAAVAKLDVARGHDATLAELDAAVQHQRTLPPPEPEAGVPDLYFGIQRRIEAQVGAEALGWLRLGLSRNDLDMTVYVMAARARLLDTGQRLAALQSALLDRAEEGVDTLIVARTHHQPAQPSTLGHRLAASAAAIDRDQARLLGALERLDRCPLGAAALTGSSFPLDRHASAEALGFSQPVENTYDAVASGDWQLDLVATSQLLAVGLSRLVHDLLRDAELGVLRLPDDLVQGSSIMPQKRNPVALEHARTRFSRVAGAAGQFAFLSHNIPHADLNDVGTDAQEPLHDLFDTLDAGLDLLVACLEGGRWDAERLAAEVTASDTTATELADELVRRAGLSFPEAHRVTADLVTRLAQERRPLHSATANDLAAVGAPSLADEVLADALSPAVFVARRDGFGGPAPDSVRAHTGRLRTRCDAYHEVVAQAAQRIDGALRTVRARGKDAPA